MPTMGSVPTNVVRSIISLTKKHPEYTYAFSENSLVYDARNGMADIAITYGFDYLMFIDSDIVFREDAVDKLIEHNADVCTGVYYSRRDDHEPLIFSEIKPRTLFHKAKLTKVKEVLPYQQIEACGMGFCLIKTDVLKKIKKRHKTPFEPIKGMGEDYSFCYKCKKHGIKIYADGDITLFHIGKKEYGKEDYDETKQ